MFRRLSTMLIFFALASGGLSLVAPNATAAIRPTVSIKAPAQVHVNDPIRITGTVTGHSVGATVVLQRWYKGEWRVLNRSQVRANKTYLFRTFIRNPHRPQFRVKVPANPRLKVAVSHPVPVHVTPAPKPSTDGPAPESNALTAARATIADDTNAYRRAQGLAPLRMMPALNDVAQAWSTHMGRNDDFRHNPTFYDQYPSGWSSAGENIAYGYSLGAVTKAWYESEGHRRNMLGNFSHIGIGVYTDSSGRKWYTQNFARY